MILLLAGIAAAFAATDLEAAGSFDRAIEREMPLSEISYLLIDARTLETLASRWPDANHAIPLGSLVKPFLAIAAIEAGVVPSRFHCAGDADRCWLPSGHGALTLSGALAHSCNASFLKLASRIPESDLERVCTRYGVPVPGDETTDTRIGLGTNWRIAPSALVSAYVELVSRRSDSGVSQVLDGLRNAAHSGTARGLGIGALAKTGTAPCVSAEKRHAGDGFTLAMFPPDAPRYVLLVRVHGVPGAQSAKTAGRLARLILNARTQ